MKMDEGTKERIEEIISSIKCPKNFECYKSKLEKLCKVRNIDSENLFECLDENQQKCGFSLPFGNGHFCKCPLRILIAKEFNK